MTRPPLRRMTAVISGALLLQLVVTGSGRACATSAMAAMHAGAAGASSMPGMDVHGSTRHSDQAQAPDSDPSPCQLPWAPAGCQPMAPCSPTAVASAVLRLSSPHAGDSQAAALVVIAPTSRSTPPDPPPPRA
ncbi:MAG: hypothetical protein ACR2OG_10180 [Gemmatimonadaceae bacterium]